jgi:surface polysaccharide O-acyltransferase-like enzyme
VVEAVVRVVAVFMIVMLNSQAYTSMKPLSSHQAIERADQFQTL